MMVKSRFLSLRGLLVLLVLTFTLAGCGYHIAGKSGTMPEGITSLTIPVFTNTTTKPNIEGIMTGAFVTEFVTTVNVNDEAPAKMTGVIKSYVLRGISFTGQDVTQEYRLTVGVIITIHDKKDGRVIWQDQGITDYEDYRVDITDVTRTEEVELEAFKKLSKDLARKIKERMLEGF